MRPYIAPLQDRFDLEPHPIIGVVQAFAALVVFGFQPPRSYDDQHRGTIVEDFMQRLRVVGAWIYARNVLKDVVGIEAPLQVVRKPANRVLAVTCPLGNEYPLTAVPGS